MKKVYLYFCYVLLFSVSCVDSYDLPNIPSDIGYLVVEGFINPNGPTHIQLTRTLATTSEDKKAPRELKAQVSIEGSDNSSYPLIEKGDGLYRVDYVSIDAAKKYRIRIKTTSKKEYLSDFTEVKQTAPIDSVTRKLDFEKRGMQFYIYTHDPSNTSRYYQWDYEETWQYHTFFQGNTLEYKNGQVVVMNPIIDTYTCWMSTGPTKIFTTTTRQLSNDVVYNFPLHFIPASSEKLGIGYSVLIKQYALTREEFDYLNELRKNTEVRGSIFDPQPSLVRGNLQCVTNPEEPIFGYVGTHEVQQKRIIITAGGGLPAWFDWQYLDYNCPGYELPAYLIKQYVAIGAYVPAGYTPTQYGFLPKPCVDCRERGGTNIKPDYWPL